jgi:hypothetical protein
MILKGIKNNYSCTELKREINSMRMKMNATFVETINSFITTILEDLAEALQGIED